MYAHIFKYLCEFPITTLQLFRKNNESMDGFCKMYVRLVCSCLVFKLKYHFVHSELFLLSLTMFFHDIIV